MFAYRGSTAMITGASKGLGAAFAKELAGRRMNLVLIARSIDALQDLANSLGTALRGEARRQLMRMVVFDEAHRVRNSRRLEALAREGRAFGVGIVWYPIPRRSSGKMAGNLATRLFLKSGHSLKPPE
jgi:NAD(P)-dependent dehydrogenase (short-subunit alcohol dehydrogenase family)